MTDPFRTIAAIGVVPVIAIESAEDAVALADALLEGGLPVAEITFRTPAAAPVLAKLSAERPQLLAGAGTVLDLA
ncbi:MAG: 2-dehydro-3-deoxyphosphogluconate aldolase, partial [Beijerinckiaceae bacterium]